jgi:hypothetical protein
MLLMIVLAMMGLLGVGVILVIVGTVTKTRWGINLDSVHCPKCNVLLPTIRSPRTKQQAIWGGSTCNSCGCEVDKWGRELHSTSV